MASISNSDGLRTIQFVSAGDGKRRSVRLGRVTAHQAEVVRSHVESIILAEQTHSSLPSKTAAWLASIGDELHDRLAKVGLVQSRASAQAVRLGEFLDAYLRNRADVKDSTRLVLGHTRRCLIEHFGADRTLDSITPGDADDWRQFLIRQGLADNTVRRRSGIARQYFHAAVRKGHIDANPFAGLKANIQPNFSRFYFVSLAETQTVMDALPDVQWRLIFALGRFGGLRCPSEVLTLTWADVDWDRMRMTVRASKTEHHADGGIRHVPIFPELHTHLRAAFEQAEDGDVHCITRYRDTAVNLRTMLMRYITRAGLTPWPKLWQNLRSTRETELAERFPMHVVTRWIGNSEAVAAQHYLQVTDDHYQQAVQNPVQSGEEPAGMGETEQPADAGFSVQYDCLHELTQTLSGPARTRTEDANHGNSNDLRISTPENLAESGAVSPENPRSPDLTPEQIAQITKLFNDPQFALIAGEWEQRSAKARAAAAVSFRADMDFGPDGQAMLDTVIEAWKELARGTKAQKRAGGAA